MKHTAFAKTRGEKIMLAVMHVVFIIFSVICVGSFLIVVGSSFQTHEEITQIGYRLLPQKFSLEAYRYVFASPWRLINAYLITIITTVLGTIAGLWVSATAGYVISRKNYRYRNILAFFIFFTMLFNGGLVPTYIMLVNWFHMKNTIWALIVPMIVSAWYVILFKGFFQSIPDALIESAKIDGASELKIFLRIVLPISKPAIATITLFYVLGYWNDWYLSLIYIMDESLYKLQYLLMVILKNAEFLNSEAAREMGAAGQIAATPTLNVRMAMCVLAAGPVLLVFPFFQKHFVKGITVGSIKE